MNEKLEKFTKELLRWNKTHKLTNYNEEEIKEQIKDSLYPLEKIKDAKSKFTNSYAFDI